MPARRSSIKDNDSTYYERFAAALRQVMARHEWSERRLASELGITIGTTQKYFRAGVHPLRVSTGINKRLSVLMGITLDALVAYYETGVYESDISFEDVVSWIRSSAGAGHISGMLEAMTTASQRSIPAAALPPAEEKPLYSWPREELVAAEVPEWLQEKMGLTTEALDLLEREGMFSDELVAAFAVATNLEEEAVREAFTNREAVA
jgi:hypothetical protein